MARFCIICVSVVSQLMPGYMKQAIHTHRWNPPAGVTVKPLGIYILHGTGEHAGRYTRFAERLASRGWRVGAHDHPGHGLSAGQRGLIDPAGSLATQAAIQIQTFASHTGATPLLFGHSLGGVLASELVLEHRLPVAGLLLSAPAYVPLTTFWDRIKLRLLTFVAPRLCLDLGYDASKLTHDQGEQKLAQADSLIHSFKSATLVNWLMTSGRRSLANATQLEVDTLLMIAGADPVIDSEQTRLFASRVPTRYLTVHEYTDAYHELLNEIPERREQVMVDIERWVEQYA